MELTKRKQNILASIVDGYIRTGEPDNAAAKQGQELRSG